MRVIRPIGIFIATALIAGLATWLSQPFRFPGREESMLGVISGVMLGLTWRFGWPALAGSILGMFAYYVGWHGLSTWVAAWTTLTQAFAVVVAVWGIHRYISGQVRQTPIRSLLIFYLFGILIAASLHTLLDYPMVRIAGLVNPTEDPRIYLFLYWLGEAMGILLLTPVIALLFQNEPIFSQYLRPNGETFRFEPLLWAILFASLLVATWLVGQRYLYAGISDVLMLLFALLIWSAFRFSMHTTMVAVLATSVGVFSFITFGLGGTRTPWDASGFITVLIFVIGISLMTQIISAAILERQQKARRLAHIANHDPITGLPNAQALHEQLQALLTAEKTPTTAALGYIEISEYASIRGHYGPGGRDRLLQQFSAWLRQHLPQDITPSHVTAGEFAMLFASNEQARVSLDTLLSNTASRTFEWRGKPVPIAIKAGYALVSDSFDSPRNALDIVASHVHCLPRDQIRASSIDPLNDGLIQQQELLARWHTELHQALAENRFSLVAQPICAVDGSGGKPTHIEFLLRLRSRDGELIEPAIFMPHAEQLDLMPEIDRWVVDAALKLIATRLLPDQRRMICNINLSGQSLNDASFADYLLYRLENSRVPRDMLCFEITENIALANIEHTRELMQKLHDAGCSIAVDDFGTGAATLEYLKRLPVDFVKIDGSFIRELEASQLDYIIVDAIAHIAGENDVQTIAEYVESEAVLEILRELNIDFAQGYLLGRPETLENLFEHKEEEEISHA